MKRFPVLLMAMVLLVSATGCAKKDIKQLGERMLFLEREVLDTRTDSSATKEEVRDLELRLDYLEREAVARGVKVPPRVAPSTTSQPMTSPDNMPSLPASPKPAAAAPKKTEATKQDSGAKKTSSTLGRGATFALNPAGNASATAATAAASPSAQNAMPVVSGQASGAAGGLPTAQATTAAMPPQSAGTMPRVSESTPWPATPPSAPTAAPVQTEKNAYNTALQFYRTGRFAEAEAAFQAFLEVYPNSGLVANALYWKGETFYSRSRFPDAIFSFKDVQTRFPNHLKTPDSLLKTAMAYGKLGDKANESLHLTVLFEDWPQAEATKRAQKMGLKP